ncbi:hypothetical protein HJG60_010709 [Phyllostomus discolor]|uniref:Uncharacterized protein n=1 Tax=Phyllostomus discolor TaxID=89673 RepID=A0A834APW5_9CHIR|nr:hypothetical protein HJG60_010709 [Phyllostomus discolor]
MGPQTCRRGWGQRWSSLRSLNSALLSLLPCHPLPTQLIALGKAPPPSMGPSGEGRELCQRCSAVGGGLCSTQWPQHRSAGAWRRPSWGQGQSLGIWLHLQERRWGGGISMRTAETGSQARGEAVSAAAAERTSGGGRSIPPLPGRRAPSELSDTDTELFGAGAEFMHSPSCCELGPALPGSHPHPQGGRC